VAAGQSLARILDDFDANPVVYRKSIKDAWEADPDRFWGEAAALLTSPAPPPGCKGHTGCKFLLSFLLQNANLLERIVDPDEFTKEQAIEAARRVLKLDPALDVKLALLIHNQHERSHRSLRRLTDVLDGVSSAANLLPMLGPLLKHPDECVRSKVALIMGKGNRNPAWVGERLREADGRVRANAVESIWGLETVEARDIFMLAAQDEVPRVALNGAIGLYLCGCTEALDLLMGFAGYQGESFRNSAAWAMGKLQDPRFQPVLAQLARDPSPVVRSSAMRALVRIRSYRDLMAKQGRLLVKIADFEVEASGRRRIHALVRRAGPAEPAGFGPLNFVIEEAGAPVVRYSVAALPRPDGPAIGFAMPASGELEGAEQAGLESTLRRFATEKPPLQPWAVARFENQGVRPEGHRPGFIQKPDTFLADLTAAESRPHPGLLPALWALLRRPAEQKTLIAVGSSIPESAAVVLFRRSQTDALVQEARRLSVRIHALAPPACPSLHRRALEEISSATGGRFRASHDGEDFVRQFESLFAEIQPNYRIEYEAERPGQEVSAVRLQIYSPYGLGEDTYAPEVCAASPATPAALAG
jgi:hypothetical protein